MTHRKISSSGQALVEFALVLSILVFILMGIFDLGRVVYTTTSLSNAAREGARVAAVDTNNDHVNTAVISKGIGLGIQPDQIAIVLCLLPDCSTTTTDFTKRNQASAIQVTISNYPFTAITPFIGNIFGPSGTINLSTSASMTNETYKQ